MAAVTGLAMLLNLASWCIGIASFVLYIIMVVKFFQKGKTAMGIISLAGIIFCGIGPLIAFIYGWIAVDELEAKNVMLAWTALVVINILILVLVFAFYGAAVAAGGGVENFPAPGFLVSHC